MMCETSKSELILKSKLQKTLVFQRFFLVLTSEAVCGLMVPVIRLTALDFEM
jgi:hypothetical protein